MKWIFHEPEAGVIYSLTTDQPTTSDIFGNKSLVSKTLFQLQHRRNDETTSVSFRSYQFSAIK